MTRTQRSIQSKKRLMLALIVLAVIALGVAGAVIAINLTTTTQTTTGETPGQSTDATETDASTQADDEALPNEETAVSNVDTTPAVDPATLNSVAIEPLGITVFYSKGVPGFDFTVKRTADSTEYVQFSANELVGTKCTDDEGAFASIIKNPGVNEVQTTTETVTIGTDTYGLSLAGKSCTVNVALLDQYQSAFMNGFKSLTAL